MSEQRKMNAILERDGYENSIAWEMIKEQKRINQRQFFVIIALIIALLSSVGIAAYERLQYDYAATETIVTGTQDGSGLNIIGGGNVENGAKSNDKNNNQKQD